MMMKSFVTCITLLLLSSMPWKAETAVVLPGNSSWIGDYEDGDGTPDIEKFLPITFVIMGDQGVAIPRILVGLNDNCPTLTVDDSVDASILPEVKLRAVGDSILPHAFPIKVCEVRLETGAQKDAWSKNLIRFAGVVDDNVEIPQDPKRFLLIGDTGLRVKPDNVGLGTCEDGPKLYDIHQCPLNFTESDLDESAVSGSFQGLEQWPLRTLQSLAAEQNPDVVVYVGK
jgi:hypothetical protein